MTKIIAYKHHLALRIRKAFTRRSNCQFVLINADEPPFRRKLRRNASRMPRTAEGAVHIDAVRANRKCVDRLLGQDAHMVEGAHIVIP